jgi:hypothetical protein
MSLFARIFTLVMLGGFWLVIGLGVINALMGNGDGCQFNPRTGIEYC